MATKIGRRVIVIGNSGSGKSTLGAQLAERTGRPFIELDALHWEPNWTMAGDEIFRERVREAMQPESWVMAGNYTRKQQDVSWPEADTIIWLDLPLATSMSRTIRRCWQRHQDQEDLWGTGNRENFWDHLKLWQTDESLISYMLKTHRARRRLFESYTRDPQWSHITFIRLRSPEAVDRFFDRLRPLPIPRQATAPLS
ncbi:MAG: shikimate kinase [Thermomicrobiales bacterium]